MQTPAPLLAASLAVAVLGAIAHPVWGQSRDGRDWSREAARAVPDWVRDAVVYEVFPRAFSPEGNLAGVTSRLDHVRDLGATVVWLMPIHPIGLEKRKGTYGSPYSIRDFHAVNPDYGTAEDLKRLVREAHARGLKVILDVVANHTSWDSVMMATPELYVRDAQGRVQPPNADWSDVAKLDYANPKTRAYMIDMMSHWLRDYGVDGFRCDVAGLVPTDFWEEARPKLEAIRPDLFLLAEWSTPDLMAKAFDADYAWPFHATLNRILSLGAPASEIRATWEEERRNFPRGSLHLRFSDNHDEKRAIARFGEPAALAAQALVFTMDGIPLVYNGMEIGDTGESGRPRPDGARPALLAHRRAATRVPEVLPVDDRAPARPPGAPPGRDAVGAVLRSRPRRLVRAPGRRRGRARRRQPVEPAVDRHRRGAGRRRRSSRSRRRCPCRSSPAAQARSAPPARSSCPRWPSTPGASGSSDARRSSLPS